MDCNCNKCDKNRKIKPKIRWLVRQYEYSAHETKPELQYYDEEKERWRKVPIIKNKMKETQ